MVEMTKEYFKENILRLRREKGWSQEKLAEEAGVSYHTVFRAEAGVIPRGPNIDKLARALGVPQSVLFTDPDQPTTIKTARTVGEMTPTELAETLGIVKNGPSLDLKKRELFDLISGLSSSEADIFVRMIKRRLGRKRDNLRQS